MRLVARQLFTPTQTIAYPTPLTFTTPGSKPSFHAEANVTGADAATLRAAINPENQAVTNYHFNWGTDAGYGNTTPVGNLPTGSAPVAVSEDLSGLIPGQTYHYQLVATNGTGTTTGPDQTFTTPRRRRRSSRPAPMRSPATTRPPACRSRRPSGPRPERGRRSRAPSRSPTRCRAATYPIPDAEQRLLAVPVRAWLRRLADRPDENRDGTEVRARGYGVSLDGTRIYARHRRRVGPR